MPRYRWNNAHAWLRWSYRHRGGVTANDLLNFIAQHIGGDEIQDYFQSDMDADGYFNDLDAPTEEETDDADADTE